MDIYCKKCGEPWDMDVLHDVIENRVMEGALPATHAPENFYGKEYEDYRAAYGGNYAIVREDFYRNGCKALTGYQSDYCVPRPSRKTDAMSALIDVMGDDLDGIASMMDEAEYLGLI